MFTFIVLRSWNILKFIHVCPSYFSSSPFCVCCVNYNCINLNINQVLHFLTMSSITLLEIIFSFQNGWMEDNASKHQRVYTVYLFDEPSSISLVPTSTEKPEESTIFLGNMVLLTHRHLWVSFLFYKPACRRIFFWINTPVNVCESRFFPISTCIIGVTQQKAISVESAYLNPLIHCESLSATWHGPKQEDDSFFTWKCWPFLLGPGLALYSWIPYYATWVFSHLFSVVSDSLFP